MPSKSGDNHYSFSAAPINREKEKELDDTAMAEFRGKWGETVEYTEKPSSNIVEGVVAIGKEGGYDLIVVGKGRVPSTMVAKLADRQAEHAELGPVGDILASSGRGIVSSVLVIQQHGGATHSEETPVLKIAQANENKQPLSADEASSHV
ncbi:cation/H(+) antiporter 20-like [Momordica charantia]|uniref:Cation/H(+) antiporter 20-like n=1 Tax=Momordica charantia TaxID=3673 RepID=A0A6J1CRK1_MOMCH|nr:cation/H(+) antiporter 20-like [Momordica charantia]